MLPFHKRDRCAFFFLAAHTIDLAAHDALSLTRKLFKGLSTEVMIGALPEKESGMFNSWDPKFCFLVPIQIVTFEENAHSCCAFVSIPFGLFLTPINCHMPFATEMDLQYLLDRRHFGCEGMCFQLLTFLIASAGVKKRPRSHVP